jgi:hypothetical protein
MPATPQRGRRTAEVPQEQPANGDGISIGEIDPDKLPGTDQADWPIGGVPTNICEMRCIGITGPGLNIVWKIGSRITQ